MQKLIVKTDAPIRADVYLSQVLDTTRSQVKNMFDQKNVLINGKNAKSGTIVTDGDYIDYQKIDTTICAVAQDIPLDIVFEDQNYAVINKPKGLVVHPAAGNKDGTLVNALLYHFNGLSKQDTIRAGIVHRIDKDTAGLLLVAKNDKAHAFLAKQIADKTCSRTYVALLIGQLPQDEGVVETGFGRSKTNRKKMSVYPLGQGKIAITYYKVLKRYNGYCLVQFSLKTGRTHQIRVHCAYQNHPIVGDTLYGGKSHLYGGGQLLFAQKLEFYRPFDGQKVQYSLPLPDYFEKVLKNLKE